MLVSNAVKLWFARCLFAAMLICGSVPKSVGAPMTPPDPNAVLILYDSSGEFGWIGQLHSKLLANLLGHFPLPCQIAPVEDYRRDDLNDYRATFYFGTIFNNALPAAFLDDVMASRKPVCWFKYNLWSLGSGSAYGLQFEAQYGFRFEFMDQTGFTNIDYKAETLTKYPADPELGRTTILNSSLAQPVARAWKDSPSNAVPYAVRASNFWYIADVPFSYMAEEDRYLAFSDMLHDIVQIPHAESRRAIIRLEDVDPTYPPELLRRAADYLASEGVPFCVAVVPVYKDPLGYYNGGVPEMIEMSQAMEFVQTLKYMVSKGAQLVMHGYTHQYDAVVNPFTAVTGDDYEFFRVTYDAQTNLVDYTAVPDDSRQWVQNRLRAGLHEFRQAGLTAVAWETPHYGASALDYGVFAENFALTIQRVLYFDETGHAAGQFFPYIIERDSYGQKIMPENLGNIDPEWWYIYPPRFPSDLIRAARKNRVVRDGWASAFFHPYLDLAYLRELIAGIKGLGYTYVPLADNVPPTITADPQSVTTNPGVRVTFTASCRGDPAIKLSVAVQRNEHQRGDECHALDHQRAGSSFGRLQRDCHQSSWLDDECSGSIENCCVLCPQQRGVERGTRSLFASDPKRNSVSDRIQNRFE